MSGATNRSTPRTTFPSDLAAVLLGLLGAVAGAAVGLVSTGYVSSRLLPGCGPQPPGHVCDGPAMMAMALAIVVGAPFGGALGALAGWRIARRLTRA